MLKGIISFIVIGLLTFVTGLSAIAICSPANAPKITQDQYTQYFFIAGGLVLAFYILLCLISKVNVSALWLSALLFIPGALLVGYSTLMLGEKRTLFGLEFGTVNDDKIEVFPFTMGHPQYKGLILCIIGLWCAFHPTFALTFTTAAFVLAVMLHIVFETARDEKII